MNRPAHSVAVLFVTAMLALAFSAAGCEGLSSEATTASAPSTSVDFATSRPLAADWHNLGPGAMWVGEAPVADGDPLAPGDRVLILTTDPQAAGVWSYDWPDGPDRGLQRAADLPVGTIVPAGFAIAVASGRTMTTVSDWLVGTSAPAWIER